MTYPEARTFWLEPTDRIATGLRRYADRNLAGGRAEFTCATGYHSALVFTGEDDAVFDDRDTYRVLAAPLLVRRDDPQWPTHCACGYAFTDDDHWQEWQELIYERADTGDRHTLRERQASDIGWPPAAPPGAMWDAWWMPQSWAGPDGIHLMVRLPNGRDWHVDSHASNCTRPSEPHQCWVRHGDPRECRITVDKNGDTCEAGAGSIQAADYHGFLRDGVLAAG